MTPNHDLGDQEVAFKQNYAMGLNQVYWSGIQCHIKDQILGFI